jgi:uncharacterized RDD family membrane protein YckC
LVGAQFPPPGTQIPPGWTYPFRYPVAVPAPRPHGLQLAASGARLLARLIDIFVVLMLNVVVNGWFIYQYVREVSPVVREVWDRSLEGNHSTAGLSVSERAANLQIVIVLLATALWFAYEVPAVANTGQTLGKRLLGIRVVRLDNTQRLGFGRSFRRWNTMGLPTLLWSCCGIGFVLQFVDALFVAIDRPLRQALHDKSALTVVVQVGQSRAAPETEAADDQAHSRRS